MQQTLDAYGAGVLINVVQLQAAQPPAEVSQAFVDVNAAQQDAVRVQNEAETFASRVVPEARGEAARTVQQAEAYREQSVADASGQAGRFRQVYEQYRKAPDVIRERIFLETMERVFGGIDKIIIDQNEPERRALSCRSTKCATLGAGQPPAQPPAAGSHPMNAPALRTVLLDPRSRSSRSSSSRSIFVVHQTQYALVLRFGAVQADIRRSGPAFQAAARRQRDLFRQAGPRSRPAGADGALRRPAEPRGRRLHALPHRRSAALLSGRRTTSRSPTSA